MRVTQTELTQVIDNTNEILTANGKSDKILLQKENGFLYLRNQKHKTLAVGSSPKELLPFLRGVEFSFDLK
jgi:hypothetical protein